MLLKFNWKRKEKKEQDPIEVAIQGEILSTLDDRVLIGTELRDEVMGKVSEEYPLSPQQRNRYSLQFHGILTGLVKSKMVTEEMVYDDKKTLKRITYTKAYQKGK